MDSKQIRELVELVSGSDLESLELESEGFTLRLVRRSDTGRFVAQPQPAAAPATSAVPHAPPMAAAAPAVPAPSVDDGLVEMTSPIVGTFYTSPGPGSAAFVEVGGKIQKGKVVCIIEAMKVMNEIEAEINAEVVEIVVADGQPVEYGEVLFKLRPL